MAIEIGTPKSVPLWRVALQARPETLHAAIRGIGVARGETMILWRGPGLWLLSGPEAQDLAHGAAAATGAVALDITGALLFWRVDGAWPALLAHGSPLDPGEDGFVRRGVAWTKFVHFEIGITRDAPTCCHIIGARSVSRDLDTALHRAARHAKALP